MIRCLSERKRIIFLRIGLLCLIGVSQGWAEPITVQPPLGMGQFKDNMLPILKQVIEGAVKHSRRDDDLAVIPLELAYKSPGNIRTVSLLDFPTSARKIWTLELAADPADFGHLDEPEAGFRFRVRKVRAGGFISKTGYDVRIAPVFNQDRSALSHARIQEVWCSNLGIARRVIGNWPKFLARFDSELKLAASAIARLRAR